LPLRSSIGALACLSCQSGSRIDKMGRISMRALVNLAKQLKSDEDGAALIEYTVLLGILLVAVIASIGTVGTWISGQWTSIAASL
jgi:pilus assembly protein Flp/PilA